MEEPDPGRVLREVAIDGDLATTSAVTPAREGRTVEIETTRPAAAIRGFVERLVAPRLLKPL